MIGEMIQYYKDFLDQHRDDPALRLELAERSADRRPDQERRKQGRRRSPSSARPCNTSRAYPQVLAPPRGPRWVCTGLSTSSRSWNAISATSSLPVRRLSARVSDPRKDRPDGAPQLGAQARRTGGRLGQFRQPVLDCERQGRGARAYLQALEIQKDLVGCDPAAGHLQERPGLDLPQSRLSGGQQARVRCDPGAGALASGKQLVEMLPGNPVFRRHLARTYESLGETSSISSRPRML